MNKVILIGRLTADPKISYSGDTTLARYSIAVDRPAARQEQKTDFISCVAFNKKAEFAENYLRKGTKIAIIGRLQTGSYTNKEGIKVYTTDVVVENNEFCESKKSADDSQAPSANDSDSFMNIADTGEELPFD